MASQKQVFAWLVLVTICALFSNEVFAAKKPPRATMEALVISVDGTNLKLNSASEKQFIRVTVATNGKTEVTIDGKPGKLSALKEGDHVTVSPAKGKPTLIEAKKPHGGKAVESGLMEGRLTELSTAGALLYTPLQNGDIAAVKFPIGEKAIVVVDGKETPASNLKAGQYVMVAFVGGTVRRIIVQPTVPAN